MPMFKKKKVRFLFLLLPVFLIFNFLAFSRVGGEGHKQFVYKALLTPNDSLFAEQWNLTTIKAPEGWNVTTGNAGTIIAVLDTGILLTHEDLVGKLVPGYDFISGDSDPNPDPGGGTAVGHGTAVASAAAAATNNSLGIAGVCWQCKIMPIRVLDNDGNGTTDQISLAIRYAADNGAKVVNMSFGYEHYLGPDPTLFAALDYAYSKGVVMVAAAGNSGSAVNYPAAYDKVIAVGATDNANLKTSWSCYGPELDVMAPGEIVPSAHTSWGGISYSTNEYSYMSGTSISSPQVAGEAALIFSHDSTLTPAKVYEDITTNTLLKNPRNDYYGYGLVSLSDIFNISSYLKVSASLAFSNLTPAAGETLTEAFSLRNTSASSITVDIGLADLNLSTGQWDSFTPQTGITFAASETKYLSFNRIVKYPGQHKSWIALNYNGIWYDARPLTGELTNFTYTVRVPNINVEIFAFDILPPILSWPVNATVRIKNLEPNNILLNGYGVPNYNQSLVLWRTFDSIEPAFTLTPGETKTMVFTKTLTESGYYEAWPAMNLSGCWYPGYKNGVRTWAGYWPQGFTPSGFLKVSASLAFSNLTPAAGETLTEAFSLRNTSASSITVDIGLADLNLSTGQWDSFTPQTGITFAASETKYLSFNRIVKYPGQHKSWIALNYNGIWYDARPLTGELTNFTYTVRVPNINVDTFWFSKLPPVKGETFNATLTIRNNEAKSITFTGLGIPNQNLTMGNWKTFTPITGSFTLAPGATRTEVYTNTLTESGSYKAWPAMGLGGEWQMMKTSGITSWVSYLVN